MLMPVAMAGVPSFKDFSGTWQQFMGMPYADQADAYKSLADYGKAPADEAWVYRCVALKAAFAASVPLRVYVKSGRERIPAEDSGVAMAEDLQFLLDDVNPVSMNGGDLKAFSNAATSVWGENYVKKVRGRLGGPPKELYWLRAPDITPNMGRVWIDSYDYRSKGGDSEIIASKDMLAWRRLNLQDPTRGLSPLSSVRYEIAFGRMAAEAASNTLANWNIPAGAWVIPKDAEFTTQDKNLVKRALALLRGPKGAGKTPILPQGLTWQAIGMNAKDAEYIAGRKLSRMSVCAAEGVPLVLAGDDEKTSVYANMRDAERIFARYMITELDWTADGYNGWLVPDFDPARKTLIVAFDYSQIEALQAPLEDRKRVALSEIEHGARTGDEYRAEFRTGQPLPNDEGKVVTRLSTLVPIGDGPDAAPAETTQTPTDVPSDDGSDTIRALRTYYKSGDIEPLAALLGVSPSDADLLTGLKRRYTAKQLLDGVPSEHFAGLRMRTAA